jgi:hypothetical protein
VPTIVHPEVRLNCYARLFSRSLSKPSGETMDRSPSYNSTSMNIVSPLSQTIFVFKITNLLISTGTNLTLLGRTISTFINLLLDASDSKKGEKAEAVTFGSSAIFVLFFRLKNRKLYSNMRKTRNRSHVNAIHPFCPTKLFGSSALPHPKKTLNP